MSSRRPTRAALLVTRARVPAPTCLLVAALALGGGAAAQPPAPAVDPAGVDLLRPDGSWTQMRLDGCEVRTEAFPDHGFDGRWAHRWRCGDATRARAVLEPFLRAVSREALVPEPSARALPARHEHRAVVVGRDGSRWIVAGPAWREDAQRAYELGEAWDALFPEPDEGDATSITLWTPLEAYDDHGAPLRQVVLRPDSLFCARELTAGPAPIPAPIPDLIARMRAMREAHPDEECELTQWRGCLRTGCDPEPARAWLSFLATLPPECEIGCARVIAPPRGYSGQRAADEDLRQRRIADPERYR